jgi:hypothetical protein
MITFFCARPTQTQSTLAWHMAESEQVAWYSESVQICVAHSRDTVSRKAWCTRESNVANMSCKVTG